jgi:lauroyl/myristoyl acyltransferase
VKPSVLYRSELWRLGLIAAKILPPAALHRTAVALTSAYFAANARRRAIVVGNLLPALQNDPAAAQRCATELFRNFAVKLADLWRYEVGKMSQELLPPKSQWMAVLKAKQKGRGLLLVTPHIGNWEFGAPILISMGFDLQVITMAEPQESLTKLRQNSRSQWGIQTFVLGQNPFAFVEIIRRLEEGATVALLIDRPPAGSGVTVKLFGRKFHASIAPAELARASGCTLVPVCLPRTEKGYSVELLPEMHYDRAALGNREARANLTQEMMRVFEPMIRTHLNQWYHFVPIWEKTAE